MAGNYRFELDQEDIVRSLITTVGSFIQDRLINKEERNLQKEHCAERLAAEDGGPDKDTEVRYSDQAVLANLDWGIEALEEAISTSNLETKMARLDYAEKMLQVCAMLNTSEKTAGVPNFYLSAWAHLNLSYLWKLRNNAQNAVLHILDMFAIDPFFSRIDFAPELWKSLFLPHMSSIVGWYSEGRHRIVMDVIPDSNDLSFTVDFDQYFNESLIMSVRPDQAEKMQELENLYRESLDENTRLYAKYYQDCINYDSATTKKAIPMLPIAEPPMTPLHEVSRKIPDYVKFGPILPKTAGFSPVLKGQDDTREASRSNLAASCSENSDDFPVWDATQGIPEEEEEEEEGYDNYEPKPLMASKHIRNVKAASSYSSIGSNKDAEDSPRMYKTGVRSQSRTPVDSPRKKESSPRMTAKNVSRQEKTTSLLRLASTRTKDAIVPIHASLSDSPSSFRDGNINSADFDDDLEEQQSFGRFSRRDSPPMEKSFSNESDDGNHSCISLPLSEKQTPGSRPPKDFVCPITGQIFNDPVTLETGQTYERRAIQEWIDRGNVTCPITRQPLSATELPKTNYVLKRLITSWKEQHPGLDQELSYAETPRSNSSISSHQSRRRMENDTESLPRRSIRRVASVSTSPTSVLSEAAVETVINAMRPHISCLCDSENLQECEAAVLTITRIWIDSKVESGIHAYMSSQTIVNGFIEILSASLNREVLRATIYILSQLICSEYDSVGDILNSMDSEFFDCLATLLKNGLAEAAILIYLLRPSFSQLFSQNLIPSLIQLISIKSEDRNRTDFQFVIAAKDAALVLLEQIITGGDERTILTSTMEIVSSGSTPAFLKCLDRVDGRQSCVLILLCCIRADHECKNLVATRIELSPVLEMFHAGNDSIRGTCIEFIYELVQLNRRILCNQILQKIKDEGTFSTMHTLLVYLQMAPMEQKPATASLLLQLDLLVEPRKMSIYREEAIEVLIEALRRKEFPASQVAALDVISSLPGHISKSGKSSIEAWLLKLAGFDQPYNTLVKGEKITTSESVFIESESVEDERKAVRAWERRMAFVICNHEKGSIFKALEECLNNSNSLEIAKSCLVVGTWLVHMLFKFPDTGTRDVARKCLLDQFINVLQSSKSLEEKILATLALRGFINDPGALNDMGPHAKNLYKTLRKLKCNAVLVDDLLKALINLPSIDAAELWCYVDGPELNASVNGEVLSMLHVRGRLISSHSDGTINVWDTGRKNPRLIQEVRQHTKAVTCLCLSPSGTKMFSGSLDKTIRIWAIKQEEIHCVQIHDVKEPVLGLSANSSFACFFSQTTGVKVYSWSGAPKHVNFNKNVKCVSLLGDKLYCGCTNYSLQEVDIGTLSSTVFYAGTRKLLGKQTIYSVEINGGLLIAGGSSVDGIAGKVFTVPSKSAVGTLSTTFDIQNITSNNDFIFTASKCGIIEVWLKGRVTKIGCIRMPGGNTTKLLSVASDIDGQMLFAGSSEGKIQVWLLN
ncbi:OLC1v1018239C1 [Oldenlandia corymbosa var. corymbosa]|uniref:RING-type E3 ubiquitin transferase n=1 Tax=Oldenlandia corymbosa var. corymbosa TaxID=529605 RepID=A0AAV1EB53_OLDCO|nr:OLC1v1018239C1 [Oldenlandia corymbosa var. corymbosa]